MNIYLFVIFFFANHIVQDEFDSNFLLQKYSCLGFLYATKER